VEGALAYSSVIPIGAINITKDLAAGLRISLESSEKIKIHLSSHPKLPVLIDDLNSSAKTGKGDKVDDVDLTDLGLPEELKSVSRKTLIDGIIKPRLNEIFTMVGLEIKRSGFGGMTPSGVVISGGGALTVGASDAARKNLAMPVRVGMPKRISGLIDEITSPVYAAAIGLLLYGGSRENQDSTSLLGGISKIKDRVQVKGIAGKLVDLVKSFLP